MSFHAPDTWEAIREWLEYCEAIEMTADSQRQYSHYVQEFFMDYGPASRFGLDYRDVKLGHLLKWKRDRSKFDPHGYERRKAMNHAYTFWHHCGYVAFNPVAMLPAKRPGAKWANPPDRRSLELLRAAAYDYREFNGLAIDALCWTGARANETVNIRPEDIQGEIGSRVVVLRKTKRAPGHDHDERVIPLEGPGWTGGAEVFDRLVELGPITANRRNSVAHRDTVLGVNRKTLYTWVRRHGEEAGIDPDFCKTHRIRAAFATDMSEAGVPVEVIQKLMGHKKIETTLRYILVRDPRVQAGMEALSLYRKLPA